MPLEKQVISLTLAQRLHKLGVPQASFWYWTIQGPDWSEHSLSTHPVTDHYAAFSVAELGDLLPGECSSYKHQDFPWCALYHGERLIFRTYGNTEADARAQMLIDLLKRKLIDGGR